MAASKKATLAALLPPATTAQWGIALHYELGSSDKEYRVAVRGAETVFQWGRRFAAGETKHQLHPDPLAADTAARRQWAAKEAKGYWPTTGIVPLGETSALPKTGDGLNSLLADAYEQQARKLLRAGTVGDQLWLCQAPPADAPTRTGLAALTRLAGGTDSIAFGQYLIVAADEATSLLLRAVCPVAAAIGSRSDADMRAVADVAAALAADITFTQNPRERLAAALDTAHAVIG